MGAPAIRRTSRREAPWPRTIVLIGFMGTGKSRVGKALARRLGWSFTDIDACIERLERRSISRVFQERGEEYFRRVESAVIRRESRRTHAVIAAGGGAVLRAANVRALKARGVLVCLTAPATVILQRLEGDESRPLLKKGNKLKTIREILRNRAPVYAGAADVRISTAGESIGAIVRKIMVRLTSLERGR